MTWNKKPGGGRSKGQFPQPRGGGRPSRGRNLEPRGGGRSKGQFLEPTIVPSAGNRVDRRPMRPGKPSRVFKGGKGRVLEGGKLNPKVEEAIKKYIEGLAKEKEKGNPESLEQEIREHMVSTLKKALSNPTPGNLKAMPVRIALSRKIHDLDAKFSGKMKDEKGSQEELNQLINHIGELREALDELRGKD